MNLYEKFARAATRADVPHHPYPIFWRPWGFGLALALARLGGAS